MTAPARARRAGLGARIAVFGIATAVVTGVIAGILAAGLINTAVSAGARAQLDRLADSAAALSDTPRAQQRLRLTLLAIHVRVGWAGPAGGVDAADPLVAASLSEAQLDQVRAGQPVTLSETVHGIGALVAARPTPDGGAVVLAQRHVDAGAVGAAATRRTMVAILIGVAVAAAVGMVLARRIARPLRRAARAARQLAVGRRDVTVPAQGPREVAAIAEAVTTLAGELARSEARQREFFLSVSHELRTPLTAITGYAESLADGTVPPEDGPAAAGVILTEAQRLTRLINDLLDLARLDSPEFRITPTHVDLAALARAAADVWHTRCAATGVEFTAQLPDEPVWIDTDPTRLRQVLDALFDNALRITPAGRPIVLDVRVEPDAAVVEVRDGGPGLTDDDLAVAFHRAELHRRYRGIRPVGTGLGLAIVARLTARLGGSVEAGHAPEGGARFTVRLPRTRRQ